MSIRNCNQDNATKIQKFSLASGKHTHKHIFQWAARNSAIEFNFDIFYTLSLIFCMWGGGLVLKKVEVLVEVGIQNSEHNV